MNKLLKQGTEEKPIILNKIMTDLTDKYVKHHRDDLIIDFSILLNRKDLKNFIWILREEGTWMLEESTLEEKDSFSNVVIEHCIKNNQILKVFKITVIKRTKKNNIYGMISEMTKKTFLKSLDKLDIA